MNELTRNEAIPNAFDHYCKVVLKNKMIDYRRLKACNTENEIVFSDLPRRVLSRFATFDEPTAEFYEFRVVDQTIYIENEALGNALSELTEAYRTVLLCSFFLGMRVTEIASLMSKSRQTISTWEKNALQKMRRLMEEMTNEE